ncbi:hypothetical protein HDU97_000816 [Phlyctochytrium planicorne]|nr:hypothetical protein HDU97_000816 [Phlyctochytrium planicorne]
MDLKAEQLAEVLISLGYSHERKRGIPSRIEPEDEIPPHSKDPKDNLEPLTELFKSALSIESSRPMFEWMVEAFKERVTESVELPGVQMAASDMWGEVAGMGNGKGGVGFGFDVLSEEECELFEELQRGGFLESMLQEMASNPDSSMDTFNQTSNETRLTSSISELKSFITPVEKQIATLEQQINTMRSVKEQNAIRLKALLEQEQDLDRRIAKQCGDNAHTSGQVDTSLQKSVTSIKEFFKALTFGNGDLLFQHDRDIDEFLRREEERIEAFSDILQNEFGEIKEEKAMIQQGGLNEVVRDEIERLVSVNTSTERQHFEELLGLAFAEGKLEALKTLTSDPRVEALPSKPKNQIEKSMMDIKASVEKIRKSVLLPMWAEISEMEVRDSIMGRFLESKKTRLESIISRLHQFKQAFENIFDQQSQLNGALEKDFELLRHQAHVIESLNQELLLKQQKKKETQEYLSLPDFSTNRTQPRFVDTSDTALLRIKENLERSGSGVGSKESPSKDVDRNNPTIVCSLETLYSTAKNALLELEDMESRFLSLQQSRQQTLLKLHVLSQERLPSKFLFRFQIESQSIGLVYQDAVTSAITYASKVNVSCNGDTDFFIRSGY